MDAVRASGPASQTIQATRVEIGNDVAYSLVITAQSLRNLSGPLAARTGQQDLATTEDK
jgi:hypothetical protein